MIKNHLFYKYFNYLLLILVMPSALQIEIVKQLLMDPNFLEELFFEELQEEKEIYKQLHKTKSPRNIREQPRDRGHARNEMFAMSDDFFKLYFRLSRTAFQHLLNLIEPIIKCEGSLKGNVYLSHSIVEPSIRLAV